MVIIEKKTQNVEQYNGYKYSTNKFLRQSYLNIMTS